MIRRKERIGNKDDGKPTELDSGSLICGLEKNLCFANLFSL